MKEKDYVTPPLPSGIKLKFSGTFDLDLAYRRMKYWLDYNGFGENIEEEEYYEAKTGDSKRIAVRWYTEKEAGSYFGYVIEINFILSGLRKVELEREGRTISLDSGTIEIALSAYVVKDKKEKYKNKVIQKLYENLIIKNRVDEHKGKLYTKVYELQDAIRRFFASV